MKRRRRWLIALGIIAFMLFILPFLIPLPPAGVDPVALYNEIRTGTVPDGVNPALVETLSNPDGSYIEVDGVQIYVIDKGAEDAPAVIFLHGFGGSTFTWRLTLDAVADAGYRAIAFDRPPFGMSQRPASLDYAAPAAADFTAHLMDVMGIETATLVGHSAGGTVLAHFALNYPERVDKLVIVSGAVLTGGGAPPFVGSIVGFPPITRWTQIGVRIFITPERLSDILSTAYARSDFMRPAIALGYQLPLYTLDWDSGLVALVRDSARNAVPQERLPEITANTLLLWGANDTWVPPADGAQLAEILPNATLQTYDNVGHLPMEEADQNFNLDLIGFLNTGELPAEAEFQG